MQSFPQDLRFAFRQFARARGLTLTVVLTLALGIGATTAMFSLIEGILLRPLPFRDPEHLVILGDHLRNGPNTPVTALEIPTYREATTAFSSMGAYLGTRFEFSGDAIPEQIAGEKITADVFPTLGVAPVLGRAFTREEEAGHQPLAVISYSLWLNRFHRDRNVAGKSITLDRKGYTILGVMPRSFEFPLQPGHLDQAQIWIPMSLTAEELNDQGGFWGYHIVARLKDGVTISQAAQDADRVAKQIMRDFPPRLAAIRISGDATPLREYVVGEVRPILRTLFLAGLIVLLIACANVAGLLLVQAIRRRREYAVRLALGSRAGAILRSSLLEAVILSFCGALVGLALASVMIRTAVHLLPESMPRVDSISMDKSVVCFALGLAFVSGALCSLAPAFAALRANVGEALKQNERTGTGASHAWLRSALVIVELAVALVLLTTCGAFVRSFQKMRAVDPGFRPDHVLVAGYALPLNHYSTQESADSFDREVMRRLASKPGVLAVGITGLLPGSGAFAGAAYTIEDEPVDRWKLKFSSFQNVDGDYFRAMQTPLLDGRYFNENDSADAPLVIIVNATMAKDCWPGQRAIGKRMHVGNPKKGLPWATVVGVVADTKSGSRDEPSADQWYSPEQQPAILGLAPNGKLDRAAGGFITLRSGLPPEQMIHTLRSTVSEMDPLLALTQVQRMDDVISNVEAPRRFNTYLVSVFAAGALLLAVTGIYAVVAFAVSLRTQEIAVRMALGAQPRGIARLVVAAGLKSALLGCSVGVLGSLAASTLVRSFLFQVSATDPLIYLGAIVIMVLLTLLASALPAIRASRVDPLVALRYE